MWLDGELIRPVVDSGGSHGGVGSAGHGLGVPDGLDDGRCVGLGGCEILGCLADPLAAASGVGDRSGRRHCGAVA